MNPYSLLGERRGILKSEFPRTQIGTELEAVRLGRERRLRAPGGGRLNKEWGTQQVSSALGPADPGLSVRQKLQVGFLKCGF